jgi:hypothetical protein
MKIFRRAICLVWLLALWALSTAPSIAALTFSPAQTPFTYDGQNQAKIAYDETSQPVSDYDSAAVPFANDTENQTVGASGLFANFNEFLAADSAATETFYRTMSQGDYQQFLSTRQIPATGETFVSPSVGFSQQYNGVTVQFNVQAGTSDALMGMGVRNSAAGFAGTVYEGLPTVSSGWTDTSAFFKWEGGTVNIGLGNGPALNTFNNNIVSFGLVPKP